MELNMDLTSKKFQPRKKALNTTGNVPHQQFRYANTRKENILSRTDNRGYFLSEKKSVGEFYMVMVMVFNATFNNISVLFCNWVIFCHNKLLLYYGSVLITVFTLA